MSKECKELSSSEKILADYCDSRRLKASYSKYRTFFILGSLELHIIMHGISGDVVHPRHSELELSCLSWDGWLP